MGRLIRNWTAEKVEDSEVAPHRYRYDGTLRASDGEKAVELWECRGYEERKKNLPYVDGEVVWVERDGGAKKARIWLALVTARDRDGFVREVYKVQYETGEGLWSKLWEYVHPGQIQRGYKRAGLAPEMP